MERYYIYRHIRLDNNETFYIGIGKLTKKGYTRAYNKNKRNKFWKNIVKKTDYQVDIIYHSDSHDEICKKEIQAIKQIGRRITKEGSLVNLTAGGEGVLGYRHSKKSIEKGRQTMKETIKKKGMSESVKRNWFKKGCKGRCEILVLNIETGIYYNTIKEASISANLDRRLLNKKIQGKLKNNTKFIKI